MGRSGTSVLWWCWLGGRKGIRPVKNWVVGCWCGYLSGARCRLAYMIAQLMPLTLLLQQNQDWFYLSAKPGSPGQWAVKWVVCVCVCVPTWIFVFSVDSGYHTALSFSVSSQCIILFTVAKAEVIWFDTLFSDQSLALLHVLHINYVSVWDFRLSESWSDPCLWKQNTWHLTIM